MALYINTNIWSLNAQRALATSQADLTRALQRLSTTLRINSAADDPTGHAITERYTAQINGVDQSRRNVSLGTSFTQHADSNLNSINTQLQNIRTKIGAANGSGASVATRQQLQNEIIVLFNEVERVAQTTEFDGRKILSGANTNTVFQVGPNAADTVSVATDNFRSTNLGSYRLIGNGTGTNAGSVRGGGGETITIDGYLGKEEVVVPPISQVGAASAKEITRMVNALESKTGVKATARTEIEISFPSWAPPLGGYVLQLETGGLGAPGTVGLITVTPVAAVGAASFNLASTVAAFNASPVSTGTGVVMSLGATGDSIVLTSASGDNMIISLPAGANPANIPTEVRVRTLGLPLTSTDPNRARSFAAGAPSGSQAFTGQVIFDSQRAFSVVSEAKATPAPTTYPSPGLIFEKPSGTPPAKIQKSASVASVSTIDVTAGLASIRDAFAIIDGALDAVATQRAALGSTQNRFDSIIDNLDDDFVNLTEARGYIRDADIALESSNQTRASIQNQVNIAILGQANALQQAVLALLR